MSANSMFKNKWVVGGLVAAALLYFSRNAVVPANKPAPGPTSKPAVVNAGETVSASTYRLATQRRSGMIYVPAQRKGNMLTFKSPVRGLFTRNVLRQGNQLLAEIQRA